ncbi:MAG: hypothetical protein R3250_15470, partial [Melioribacteraceae bacterium]|nr:hypothetical protein [Melioribacteraceae bacterium]
YVNEKREWHDSLAMSFELASYDFRISSIETAYRSLEAEGVDLISNRSLRNSISVFYDYHIPWLKRVETGNGRFNDLLMPYYTKHFTINNNPSIQSFRDIDDSKKLRNIVPRGFIPINTNAFKADHEFKVLLREVIYVRTEIYNAYIFANRIGRDLVKEIDEETGGEILND